MFKTLMTFVVVGIAACSGGCFAGRINSELSYAGAAETALDLEGGAVGILTPAVATGRDSDKLALGDALSSALQAQRPGVRVVSLPDVLSAINRSGLAAAYSQALGHYESSGLLDRDTLRSVGQASGVRYLAKLNLGEYRVTRGRWIPVRLPVVRRLDGGRAAIRVHLELWDSSTGELAWQGHNELVYVQDGADERPVTLREVADYAARDLLAKLGSSGSDSLEQRLESLAAR